MLTRRHAPTANDRALRVLAKWASSPSAEPDLPRTRSASHEVVELNLVLEGIHALPKSVIGMGNQLILLDQATEGLDDQLFTAEKMVENLLFEHEEPAVDANVRISDVFDARHPIIGIRVDDVKGLRHAHAHETRRLVALHERVHVLAQIQIGEPVRVVREEDLFVLEQVSDPADRKRTR